jgi:hypothetical protein
MGNPQTRRVLVNGEEKRLKEEEGKGEVIDAGVIRCHTRHL